MTLSMSHLAHEFAAIEYRASFRKELAAPLGATLVCGCGCRRWVPSNAETVDADIASFFALHDRCIPKIGGDA